MNWQVNVLSTSLLSMETVCSRNMTLWTAEESCLLSPSSEVMTDLYRIQMHTNCFYIQDTTLKDHSRTMSLLIIYTHYNSHAPKPKFQPLEYTIRKELHYIPQVF